MLPPPPPSPPYTPTFAEGEEASCCCTSGSRSGYSACTCVKTPRSVKSGCSACKSQICDTYRHRVLSSAGDRGVKGHHTVPHLCCLIHAAVHQKGGIVLKGGRLKAEVD